MMNAQITCTVADACRVSGLGRTKIYELVEDGKLSSITIGRRKLIKVDSLRTLLGEAA